MPDDEGFAQLKASFEVLYQPELLEDSLRLEYQLIQEYSKIQKEQPNLSLEDYRRLFESYRLERSTIPWFRSLLHPLRKVDNFFEWLNKGFSQIDIFPVLEYLGKMSVIVAVILFVTECDQRTNSNHYQAWEVVNKNKTQETSGGRIEALQNLHKDGVSLAGVNAENAKLIGIKLDSNFNLLGNNFILSGHEFKLLEHNFNFLWHKWIGSDLRSANLKNSDLSSAYLEKAKLINADLRSINLTNANLNHADLSNAKLSPLGKDKKTYLILTDLTGATLDKADLSGAQMYGAILVGSHLEGTYLAWAQLQCTNKISKDTKKELVLKEDINSEKEDINSGKCVDLSRAKLIRAELHGANLEGATLNNADFTGANLTAATLLTEYKNLKKVKFDSAIYSKETNIGAYLYNPNFKDKAIDLNNYNFQENPKKLPDDFLQGRDFSNLDLTGIKWNKKDFNLILVDFSKANLTKANLTGANLTKANLTKANLTGAIVKPEQLEKAKTLCNAILPNSISDQEIKNRITKDCTDKNKQK